jgi:hypothetical protein
VTVLAEHGLGVKLHALNTVAGWRSPMISSISAVLVRGPGGDLETVGQAVAGHDE